MYFRVNELRKCFTIEIGIPRFRTKSASAFLFFSFTDLMETSGFTCLDSQLRRTPELVNGKTRRGGKIIDTVHASTDIVSVNQTERGTRRSTESLIEPEPKQPKKRGPKKKPLTKEREVRLKNRRVRANARERSRMHGLNHALELLRRHVPTFSESQRLSKIETLRLAKNYIRSLTDLLTRNEPPSHLELAFILTDGLSQNTTNLIATTLQVSPRALIQLQRKNSAEGMKDSRLTWSPSPSSLSPDASSSTSRVTRNPSRMPSYIEQQPAASVAPNNSSISPALYKHATATGELAMLDTDRMYYSTPCEQMRSSSSTNYGLSNGFSPTPSNAPVIPDTAEHKLYSVGYLHLDSAPNETLPTSRNNLTPTTFSTDTIAPSSIINPYGIGSAAFQPPVPNPITFMNEAMHNRYVTDFVYEAPNSYAYAQTFTNQISSYLPGL